MNAQDDDAILRTILEESVLEYCSADGNSVLCGNFAQFFLECGHQVCIFHKELQAETTLCYACEAMQDRAARQIQRWYKKRLMRRKMSTSVMIHVYAAEKIKSFLKIVVAKKKLRNLKRLQAKEKFLRRFENTNKQ